MEKQTAAVALHYCYVARTLGLPIPPGIEGAQSPYSYPSESLYHSTVRSLCKIISTLSPEKKEALLYARNPSARGLASWWEEHERLDAKRKAEEEETEKRAKQRAILSDCFKLVSDLADNGMRFDLNPTVAWRNEDDLHRAYLAYIGRMDEDIRARAKEALGRT